jgi:hypothetical protein
MTYVDKFLSTPVILAARERENERLRTLSQQLFGETADHADNPDEPTDREKHRLMRGEVTPDVITYKVEL